MFLSSMSLKIELRYFYILFYDKLRRADWIENMKKYEIFWAVIWRIFDMLDLLRMAEWGFADHFGQGLGTTFTLWCRRKISIWKFTDWKFQGIFPLWSGGNRCSIFFSFESLLKESFPFESLKVYWMKVSGYFSTLVRRKPCSIFFPSTICSPIVPIRTWKKNTTNILN